MKKLLNEYHLLKENIIEIQQVINLMTDNNPLPFRGRGQKDAVIEMFEARNYLYCLLEEIEIRIREVKKLIVAKVFENKEKFIEFQPYENGEENSLITTTIFGLYQYQDHWYLISSNIDPKVEQHLTFIYNDLTVAIDAFYIECQSYIDIRKTIDPAPMKFNVVPVYLEIVKHFVQ